MKYLESETKNIKALSDGLQQLVVQLQESIDRVSDTWPIHQTVPTEWPEWNDRSVIPPAGVVWASDGINVWIIRCYGEPIPDSAKAVKYWTTAYVPLPPKTDSAA